MSAAVGFGSRDDSIYFWLENLFPDLYIVRNRHFKKSRGVTGRSDGVKNKNNCIQEPVCNLLRNPGRCDTLNENVNKGE